MLRHLCIRLIKKLLRMFFFQGFKNRLIFTQLDYNSNSTTYNQPTILKQVNTQFQKKEIESTSF